jgi:hypothetical protein
MERPRRDVSNGKNACIIIASYVFDRSGDCRCRCGNGRIGRMLFPEEQKL